jgi:cellobiose phosphorylase
MMRITIESILGVTVEGGDTLVIRAAIPPAWPGCRLRLRPLGRSGTYTVEIRNTSAAAKVVGVMLDGRLIPTDGGVARVPLANDGLDHGVEVELQ